MIHKQEVDYNFIYRGVLSNLSMRARRSQVLGLPCARQTHCARYFSDMLCRLICHMDKQTKVIHE